MSTDKNYVCTERAHFMCPNMHFGICAQIKGSYDKERVKQSMDVLQKAHPFLQSLIVEEKETRKLYYQMQVRLEIPVIEKAKPTLWQDDYDEISSHGWNVKKESMLKVLIYPMEKEKEFQILFIAHHLLCDGRGLLQLAEEFAQYYVKDIVPPFAEERLIQSECDFLRNCRLSFSSRLFINFANKKWEKEKHHVSYEEYLDFERNYIQINKVKRKIDTVDGEAFGKMRTLCKRHGFSVNDYLIAKMMQENHTNKVIIAADIRGQIGCYRQGAMGNYATAFGVVVKKKTKDVVSLAKQIASYVAGVMKEPRKQLLILACYLHLCPELIDAAAIATLGKFESKAGVFAGKTMFGYGARNGYSITNLGKIQSDVITEAVFIPPASPANKEIWGVLTVNQCMKICVLTSFSNLEISENEPKSIF